MKYLVSHSHTSSAYLYPFFLSFSFWQKKTSFVLSMASLRGRACANLLTSPRPRPGWWRPRAFELTRGPNPPFPFRLAAATLLLSCLRVPPPRSIYKTTGIIDGLTQRRLSVLRCSTTWHLPPRSRGGRWRGGWGWGGRWRGRGRGGWFRSRRRSA